MTTVRTTNQDARQYVQSLTPFNGNNTYARYHEANSFRPTDLYIVYSYGEHYPMFIAETMDGVTKWYENSEKYSRTTSKQFGQLHPHTDTTRMTRLNMIRMSAHGIAGVVAGE